MIRLAIIGLGAVTRNIHVPAYAKLKEKVKVVAGCDIDTDVRTWAEKKWQLPEVYENPQEMIEKTKPDIVAVCTPPFLHNQQTRMALDYGCHVFCEKPLAENLAQADEMIQGSEAAKRFVVVNTQFPYMNIHQAAKEMIGSQEFGRLLFLHAWQTFRRTEATEAGWREKMQRRLCFEFGVHVFELIRFFFEATPAKIYAHMPTPNPEIKSDVINVISLEFSDGRAASIVLDRLSQGPERYLDVRLDGEFASIHTSIGGEIRFDFGIHTKERRPFIGLNFVKGGKAVLQNGTRSKVIGKDGINPFASATAVHLSNFIDSIQKDEEPAASAKENRTTLALAIAAYDSALSGKGIELEKYCKISSNIDQEMLESNP
jgi:predicted dehydrogenase